MSPMHEDVPQAAGLRRSQAGSLRYAPANRLRWIIAGLLLIGMLSALGVAPSLTRAQGGCTVPITPSFTEYFGDLTLDGQPAPIGALVEAVNTQGTRSGCFVVGIPGIYGYLRVYGADPDTGTPGMAPNEAVTFKINGAVASASPTPVLWSGDKGQHDVDLSAISLPTAAADLRINRATGGVTLKWTSGGSSVHHYEVWRGATPYFSPGATGTSIIGDGATGTCTKSGGVITCTDSSAVGNASLNYFYQVRAFNSGGAYVDGNRVGEFDFGLTPGNS